MPNYLAWKTPSLTIKGCVCLLRVQTHVNRKRAKDHAQVTTRHPHMQNAFNVWVIFAFKCIRTPTFYSKTLLYMWRSSHHALHDKPAHASDSYALVQCAWQLGGRLSCLFFRNYSGLLSAKNIPNYPSNAPAHGAQSLQFSAFHYKYMFPI